MRSKSLLLIVAAIIATAGITAVVAQHQMAAGTAHDPSHHPMQMLQAMCGDAADHHGQAAGQHVPAELAKALDLTPAQLSSIEKKAGEACAVLRRTHEDIMNVLTPEQRTKLQEMHRGDDSATGLHALMKK